MCSGEGQAGPESGCVLNIRVMVVCEVIILVLGMQIAVARTLRGQVFFPIRVLREVADEVCFLDGGVVLERDAPDRLFSDPQQARTRQFLQRIVEAVRL